MMSFRIYSGFGRVALQQMRGFKSSAALSHIDGDVSPGTIVEITDPKIIAEFKPYVPTGENKIMEEPTRDLVNFPRPTIPLYAKPIRHWVIPETWCDFFYSKTGVSGPYAFGIGLVTFLCSKEYFVFEHDAPLLAHLAIMSAAVLYVYGAKISKFLDKQVDEDEEDLVTWQENQMAIWQTRIGVERKAQWQAKGQKYLFEAKRENVQLQLEAEYRKRLSHVYREVKKRLDYQIEVQNARQRVEQRHMANWIVKNVLSSLSEKQERENIDQCISNLNRLATA